MRLLGLDIGEARTGVAVSDPSGSVATPVAVLDSRRLATDVGPLQRIIEDYEVEELVVGLPVTLAGEEGPQAARVREVAERLARDVRLDVRYSDERLTTVEATRVLEAGGVSTKDRRGRIDMLAATLILQSYLDARRAGAERTEDT